jgi:hypothetical protein
MSGDNKKLIPIDYTHRDFTTIREDLIGIAERYYPDTFRDFSEGSFGALMIDAVAYVGDQLSFYLDYNVNEMFLDTSYQFSNIIRHGRIMGYKYTGRPSLYGEAALFIQVPASATSVGPDREYLPILKRGSSFATQNGTVFMLTENIDFSLPTNRIVVARVDESTGAPTHYAVKAYGNVVSGKFGAESITVGPFQRFLRLTMAKPNVSEIISVIDTQGNEYYEVEHLSQDMIYKEVSNANFKDDNVPSILKPLLVSRKFTVEQTQNNTYLQFGSGQSGATNVVANPQNVALNSFGKTYVTDTTFDPTTLSKTETLGTVPVNTALTVVYRMTDPSVSNVRTAALNRVGSPAFEYKDASLLTAGTMNDINSSLEVINEGPIMGNVSNLSSTEVKQRIYDTFPTQDRAVTQSDYENITYRMPKKFGSVTRCSMQRDPSSIKRNLNLYVISQDSFEFLITTNSTIKNNLKTWLNHYKMINDTIDILDPYIINVGVEFVVKKIESADPYEVLSLCIGNLAQLFSEKFFIGEHLIISNIYQTLKNVSGVLDVLKVKMTNRSGLDYSSVMFNVNNNLSPDGSSLICPKNAIFEIKFPTNDITGKIV